MGVQRRLCGFLILLALILATLPIATAQQSGRDKIEPALTERFAAGRADFIARFTEQADLSPAYTMGWDERGKFVVETLTATARRSQGRAQDLLDARGLRYQTFIAGNELYVWAGDLSAAEALAALPEVDSIRATRTYYVDPIVDSAPAGAEALDWGIVDTKADQFWTAFGVQGDGIVVANIDTGVQWNHPALDQAFKCGANPTDPACWADPSDICGGVACDNNGHGTHTMGTMVGDDDPSLQYQVGMAPNAQWIACKGCESSSCSDYALNACADWILQPGGNPANRPHVVNNSWGGGGCDTWYLAKVEAWRAAGTFPAFSAGNNGPNCMTLGSPGDYQESFASAAHDASRNNPAFSSGGPSCFGSSPYCKPNISAPGVNICSSVPPSNWNCGYSGTSMASPHSAGAVALLWSCNPALVGQIDQTFQALQDTADAPGVDDCAAQPGCGDVGCNCTYGYGYLNVLAAGIPWCGGVQTGQLDGFVRDSGGNPIASATVSAVPGLNGNTIEATTDPNGYYTMTLPVGTYDVTASKNGYTSQTVQDVQILEGQVTHQNFALTYIGQWTQASQPTCFGLTRIDAEYYPVTGKVYILGGRSGSDTVGMIYQFDPVANTCSATGAAMPIPISNYTANLVNNGTYDLLCTFGGRDSSGVQTLAVQCYNPILNTATQVATLPSAYSGYVPGAQVVVDNKVYIFGGFNPAGPVYELARTDRFDPLTNTFTQLGDLSLARAYIMAAVVDGQIYAFGGTVFDGTSLVAQTRTEKMADPGGAGTWDNAAVAEMPQAGAEGRAFGFDTGSPYGLGGKIVLAPAYAQWPGESAAVVAYDTASDSYDEDFPDLITARRNHAAAFVPTCTPDPTDGLPGMWVIGGRCSAGGCGGDNPPYAPPEYFALPCAPAPPACPRYGTAARADGAGPFGIDPDRMHWGSTDYQALNLSLEPRSFIAHFFAPNGEEIETQTFTLPGGSSHLAGLPNYPSFVGTLVLETDGRGMGGVVHLEPPSGEGGNTIFPGQADENLGRAGYTPIDFCTLLYIHNLSPSAAANVLLYIYDPEGRMMATYQAAIPALGMVAINPVDDPGLPIDFVGQAVVAADQPIQVTVHSRCDGYSSYVAAAYCDTDLYVPEVPPPPDGAILIHNPNDTPAYGQIWYASGITQSFGIAPWGGTNLMPPDPSGPAVIRMEGLPVLATVRFASQEGTFAYRAIAAAEARRAAALPLLFSGDQGWQTGNDLWVMNIGTSGTVVTIRFSNVLDDRALWYTATVWPGQVWRPTLPPLDGGRGAAILWSDPPQPIVALAGAYNPSEAAADRLLRYAGRGFDLEYVKVSGGSFTAAVDGPAVTFHGSVAEGSEPIAYAWDFGDGTSGSGQTTVHAYSAPGTYNVLMTASNVWGAYTSTYSDTVTVESGAGYAIYLPVVWRD